MTILGNIHEADKGRPVRALPACRRIPAGMTGTVTNVESHGANPWTRYTVRWQDRRLTPGMCLGSDVEFADGVLLRQPADKTSQVILIARGYGWPGVDEEEPGTGIIALAERDLAGDALTDEEADALAFRFNLLAEDWLNGNAAPEGCQFGWHGGTFRLQASAWWDAHGGRDQMFL